MIVLGLVLLIVGLILAAVVPEPMVKAIANVIAAVGAVLLLVGLVLLVADGNHLHAVLRL